MIEKTTGFCLFHKEAGDSSFRSIRPFKKKFKGHKIGFAGTLDPAASGLLIVGIGTATRLLEFFENMPKEYTVDIIPGKTSDTYDDDGEITENTHVEFPDEDQVRKALEVFTGQQQQMPPVYSAIKIAGKRACDRVRRGEDVELQPRAISIYSLELMGWEEKCWKVKVNCSKGTYIRSLAHDLGNHLGCGALASGIVRTAIGEFKLKDANYSIDINGHLKILPPEVALVSLNIVNLAREAARKFVNGERVKLEQVSPGQDDNSEPEKVQVHTAEFGLLGLGFVKGDLLSPYRTLVSQDAVGRVRESSVI